MNPLDLLIPVAHAQSAPAASQGMGSLLVMGVMFIAIVFMMIIPQSKRAKQHRELLAKLQKGDEVVTNGGIAGRITALGDSFITLEISDGVQVKFQRGAIAMVLPRGSIKAS